MLNNRKRITAGMIALLFGLGAGGFAVNAHQAESSDLLEIDPVACEIQATNSAGMMTLESVFRSEAAAHGTYRFKVVKSGNGGSSNIQQGGSFSVEPHETVTLGRVSLGGSGAIYDVSLSVDVDGEEYNCTQRYSDSA